MRTFNKHRNGLISKCFEIPHYSYRHRCAVILGRLSRVKLKKMNSVENKKSLKFIMTTIWILLTRGYDIYCTYKFSPDLSQEVNPLVSVLGMTWSPFLIVLYLLMIYTIYAYYVSVFKPINLLPTEKGYTFGNVVAYIYLGHKDSWSSILHKFPKDLNRLNHYFGHTLSKCFVYVGFISTIMWLLINYTNYYNTVLSVVAIYSILTIGCFTIIYLWNKSLFRQYQNNTNSL